MNALEELELIFRDTVHPTLSEAGFVRRDDEYHREIADGPAQLIRPQVSEHATERHVTWTFNLGCFVPELFEIHGVKAPTEPRSGSGPELRVSKLLPPSPTREFWYGLGDPWLPPEFLANQVAEEGYDVRDPASVRARVQRDLVEAVLPFFARTRSHADWYAILRSPQGSCSAFEHVVFALLCDDHDYATNMVEVAFDDRPDVRRYLNARFGVLSRS